MKVPKGIRIGRGLTRREFIAGVAAAAGTLALPGCEQNSSAGAALPSSGDTGIDHVVVVMMENRSFDHFLGWVPGADGVQSGVSLKDSTGKAYSSYNLAPQFQNADLADPDHSYAGGRTEINKGAMDGFLLPQPAGDTFPIGYYTADSLPFFKGCADNWTICDRYFCGILSSTTPNRIYMHAGQTDRLSNTVDVSTLPTVWDGMLGAGRSVAYYYTDVPYTAFWGSKYTSFSKKYDMASFAADIAAGTLADLTYIDNVGNTLNEGSGVSMDDHPYADIRNGQAFLNQVYDALRQGPNWERTLIVVNYDEWGGFYDHVPPPFAPITSAEAAIGNDGRLGCRVPCVLIGPRARRGHIEHLQFDPNSILNFLAWRFGFEPLGARANSNNIALALNFTDAPNYSAPAFDVPAGPFGQQCLPLSEAAALGVPVPPGLPVVCLPLTGGVVVTPPVPGLDVPVPGKSLNETAKRRAEHEQELDGLRELASQYGFQ
ncbi:MAG: alkaline phosphatase family protein [Stenotrophobium sp.]